MLSSRFFKQRRLMMIGSSLIAFFLLACRHTAEQAGNDSEVKAENASQARAAALGIDPNFCQDVAPGHCFTHVLLIPEKEFISDIGLSVLAFASSTGKLKPFIDKSCQEGLTEFWVENAKMRFPPRPLRHAFIAKVSRMRCIIYPMHNFEDENFELPLHPNEIGMITRLTKFELEGKEQRGQANLVVYKERSTSVLTSYRSVRIAAGSAVGADSKGWEMLNDMGAEARKAKSSFGRDVSLTVDLDVLKRDLAQLDLSKPVSEQGMALTTFLKNAQTAVMSDNPIGAALVLLGMGYEAYEMVCSTGSTNPKDAELCSYAESNVMKTSELSKGLSLVTADSSEMLRMAIIRSVSATMTDIFEKGEQQQIKRVYKL